MKELSNLQHFLQELSNLQISTRVTPPAGFSTRFIPTPGFSEIAIPPPAWGRVLVTTQHTTTTKADCISTRQSDRIMGVCRSGKQGPSIHIDLTEGATRAAASRTATMWVMQLGLMPRGSGATAVLGQEEVVQLWVSCQRSGAMGGVGMV
ncbi:hypothetical protein SLA2020_267390 [Shorea laevis]